MGSSVNGEGEVVVALQSDAESIMASCAQTKRGQMRTRARAQLSNSTPKAQLTLYDFKQQTFILHKYALKHLNSLYVLLLLE